MTNILYLIFFVFFVFFTQLSIIGYGKLIKLFFKYNYYSNEIYFEKLIEFLLGIIFLTIIGFFFYVFSITNYSINLSALLFGLIIYLVKRDNNLKKIEISTFLLLIFMFAGILISKTHEDYIPYHFQYIDIISNSEFLLGLGNLETTFLYASFFSYLQKLFVIPLFNYKLLHVPVFLIFFSICLFLFQEVFIKKKFNILNLLLLLFFLTKFSRLSEYGYDYVAGFVLLSILIIFYFTKNNSLKSSPSLILLLFLYAISIKITSLFFLPIFLLFFYKSLIEENVSIKKYLIKNYKNIIPIFVFILVIIFDNFSRSGCLFYFIELTCSNKNIIPWTINFMDVSEIGDKIHLSAKGYYHQSIISDDPELFLKFKNWLPIWYQNHFYYKISEFIILLIFLSLLIISFNIKELKNLINEVNTFKLIFLLSSLISLLFWLTQLPLLRFGFYTIICFYIFLIGSFLDINKSLKISNFTFSLIIIALLFYSGNNIKRIKNEFERNDRYKFTNFPFESRTNYAAETSFSERYDHRIKKNKYFFLSYINK